MKFKCRRRETFQEKQARLREWHRWFAWRPVKVGKGDCRWLEFVERQKLVQWYYGGDYEWISYYRPARFEGLLP